MKKYLLFLGFFLALTQSARAAFVQGAVNNASATSVTCTQPGNVTLGNVEIVGAKANGGGNFTTVTSTRVTTWNSITVTASLGYWYGTVTSTGAETITVNLPASNLVAVGCVEYSTNTTKDASANSASTSSLNITTTKTNSTLVCLAGGPATIAFSGGAGFTLRETAILLTGPNGHLLFGDVDEAATGTYACATANGPGAITVANFYAAAPVNVPRHR